MPAKTSDTRRRELGAELRKRRESAGIMGVDLARKLGWSQSAVSRIEAGLGGVNEVNVIISPTAASRHRRRARC